MSAVLEAALGQMPTRCENKFDIATQHPELCQCPAAAGTYWQILVAAFKRAARCGPDGRVRQKDLDPLITGRIPAHKIGSLRNRAIREGLIREVGRDKSGPIYELRMP